MPLSYITSKKPIYSSIRRRCTIEYHTTLYLLHHTSHNHTITRTHPSSRPRLRTHTTEHPTRARHSDRPPDDTWTSMRKQYIVDARNTPVDFQHFTPSMMLSRGRRSAPAHRAGANSTTRSRASATKTSTRTTRVRDGRCGGDRYGRVDTGLGVGATHLVLRWCSWS